MKFYFFRFRFLIIISIHEVHKIISKKPIDKPIGYLLCHLTSKELVCGDTARQDVSNAPDFHQVAPTAGVTLTAK